MARYKTRTKHTLKCYVCGSKEFEEIYVENATSRMCIASFGMDTVGNHKKDAWMYVCIDCGYILPFSDKAALDESFF
jgi:hypothetical protein